MMATVCDAFPSDISIVTISLLANLLTKHVLEDLFTIQLLDVQYLQVALLELTELLILEIQLLMADRVMMELNLSMYQQITLVTLL